MAKYLLVYTANRKKYKVEPTAPLEGDLCLFDLHAGRVYRRPIESQVNHAKMHEGSLYVAKDGSIEKFSEGTPENVEGDWEGNPVVQLFEEDGVLKALVGGRRGRIFDIKKNKELKSFQKIWYEGPYSAGPRRGLKIYVGPYDSLPDALRREFYKKLRINVDLHWIEKKDAVYHSGYYWTSQYTLPIRNKLILAGFQKWDPEKDEQKVNPMHVWVKRVGEREFPGKSQFHIDDRAYITTGDGEGIYITLRKRKLPKGQSYHRKIDNKSDRFVIESHESGWTMYAGNSCEGLRRLEVNKKGLVEDDITVPINAEIIRVIGKGDDELYNAIYSEEFAK